MYLYLGGDAVARGDDVVGIFDMDNTTVSKHTREFLSAAEKRGEVVTATWDIPKAFVVCAKPKKAGKLRSTVYLSQMAPATLRKRTGLGEKE